MSNSKKKESQSKVRSVQEKTTKFSKYHLGTLNRYSGVEFLDMRLVFRIYLYWIGETSRFVAK